MSTPFNIAKSFVRMNTPMLLVANNARLSGHLFRSLAEASIANQEAECSRCHTRYDYLVHTPYWRR